jgi:tripartite-type tricarboxylate transporter receptor subunit TctC
MKFPHRRQFLHLAAGAVALPAASRGARAQAYPARPVPIICGFPPGGTTDVLARMMGQWFSVRLGQPFIVENRPGAGTNIATEAVAKAAPDGYTLLMVSPPNVINATLYEKLNFNFLRDIAAVGPIARVANVLEVNPSLPIKSVPDFIAYAKANPGKISFASAGIGSSQHLSGEMFKMMAGIDMVHVPYRGAAPALTDLLGGQVQSMFDNVSSSIEHIRAGKLRALAVTTARRSEVLPDLPTIADILPGYEASVVNGVGAPKSTPVQIVEQLNKEINGALADARIRTALADLGSTPLPISPSEYQKVLSDETEKWGKVIRAANIKVE